MMSEPTKTCTKCGLAKVLGEFHADRRNADGLQGNCRSCRSIYRRARRTPEASAADVVRTAAWRRTPEGKAARRREYEKSRLKMIAKATAWNRAHPEKRRELVRRRRARMTGPKMPGINRAQVAGRWAYWGDLCWLCGDPATQTDHVKPVSKGGPNVAANLRPICGPCNARKSGAWPFDTRRHATIRTEVAADLLNGVGVGTEFDERRFRVLARRHTA